MKTTFKGLLITILFLFNRNSFIWGQNIFDPNLPKIIYLLEGNDEKEIVFPVPDHSSFLVFQIGAAVSEGELKMEIYNPSGERLKNSTVGFGSQLNPDKKIKATLAYLPYKNPMKGNWIIKISCKSVKGSFIVATNHTQYSEIQSSKTITGSITYENKQPLYGAIVLVKGTTIGTVTDKSGNFSLKVPDNAEYLLFYDDGMKTQEVKIGEQTKFTITLKQY
jgi:hypothetical protein